MTKQKKIKIIAWVVIAPNGNLDSVQDIYECKSSAIMLKNIKTEQMRLGKYKVVKCEITLTKI